MDGQNSRRDGRARKARRMSRLIDADVLIEDVRKNSASYFADDFAHEWVDKQPTIEERKTGKWKRAYLDHEVMGERPSIFYCSVCNQCIAYPVNYCPSCGAKMEGTE